MIANPYRSTFPNPQDPALETIPDGYWMQKSCNQPEEVHKHLWNKILGD